MDEVLLLEEQAVAASAAAVAAVVQLGIGHVAAAADCHALRCDDDD